MAVIFQRAQNIDFSLIKDVIKESTFQVSFRDLGHPVPVKAQIPECGYCEHPVILERIGNTRKAFFSSGYSFSADLLPGKNMLKDARCFDMESVRLSCHQDIFHRGTFPRIADTDPDHRFLWRRCYYGLLSAENAVSPFSGKECIVGGMHGENKNGTYCIPPRYITTTVLPEGTFEQPKDGTLPFPDYYNMDEVYFAFVCLTYLEKGEEKDAYFMNHDLGPVVWPSAGYLRRDDRPQSLGVSHPYLFRHGGYLYLYYSEELYEDADQEEGRQAGIKVARAPDDGWRPENFRTWYNGDFTEKALPEGFDRFDRRFVYEKGGRSTPIIVHPNGYNVNCFSVAKIRGMDLFLGISWDRVQNSWLWVSADLVNWHMCLQVPYFGWAVMCYPALYDAAFTTQKEIDLDDFYIVGMNHQKEPCVNAIHVSLSLEREDFLMDT